MHRGELLWEFDDDGHQFRVELQCHPLWGIEAVFFRDGRFLRCRRFYTGELATQWAERERAALTRAVYGDAIAAATRTARHVADTTPIAERTPVAAGAVSDAVDVYQQWTNLVGAVLEAYAAVRLLSDVS